MPFRSNVQRFLRDAENPFGPPGTRSIGEPAGTSRFSPGEGGQGFGGSLPSFQPIPPAAFLGGQAPPHPMGQVMPPPFQMNPAFQGIDPNQFIGQFNAGAAQMSGLSSPLGYNPYQGADFFWNPQLQLQQGGPRRGFYRNVEGMFQPPMPGGGMGTVVPPPTSPLPTLPTEPPPQGTGESAEHKRNCRRYGYSDLGPC